MRRDVRGEQLIKRFGARGRDLISGDGFRVAADIVIIFIARGGGDQQRHGIGMGDGNFVGPGRRVPALRQHPDARLKLQRAFDAFAGTIDAAQHERVAVFNVVGGPSAAWPRRR